MAAARAPGWRGAALPPTELAALEAATAGPPGAAGTARVCARRWPCGWRWTQALEAQAGLPSFAAWRQHAGGVRMQPECIRRQTHAHRSGSGPRGRRGPGTRAAGTVPAQQPGARRARPRRRGEHPLGAPESEFQCARGRLPPERLAPAAQRGTLVVLSAPASIRPWWHSFASLLKPVAAVAGKRSVAWRAHSVIHGEAYGPDLHRGRWQAAPASRRLLRSCPKGPCFWPAHSPKAWTGAILAMTPIATLTARAVPLWTWR